MKSIEASTFRELVRERLQSGDWWVVLPAGEVPAELIREIIRTYYGDIEPPYDENSDFHAVIIPPTVVMFHKRRMGATEFSAICRKHGVAGSVRDIAEHIDRGKPIPLADNPLAALVVGSAFVNFIKD